MDKEEKKRSILKHRRHEISEEYARRRDLEDDKAWSLNTDEVTISIENLQSYLSELTKDITLEKHQQLIGEYKQFFDELGSDQNILFEIINVYKEKKGIAELGVNQESIQVLHDKVQSKIPKLQIEDNKEISIETTIAQNTWDKFNDIVHKTGLDQKDCISLSLRLFVDYCTKILAENMPSKTIEKKADNT
jgi:hypothetical protein